VDGKVGHRRHLWAIERQKLESPETRPEVLKCRSVEISHSQLLDAHQASDKCQLQVPYEHPSLHQMSTEEHCTVNPDSSWDIVDAYGPTTRRTDLRRGSKNVSATCSSVRLGKMWATKRSNADANPPRQTLAAMGVKKGTIRVLFRHGTRRCCERMNDVGYKC
jgi:hypothetical protein